MTRFAPALLLVLAACGDGGGDGGPGGRPAPREPEDRVVAIRSLWFAREEAGVSEGFDLDGADGTCGVADLVSPDGRGSIDNGFAGLLPALELTEAVAVEALIQQTIAMGELVITLELRGLDVDADGVATDDPAFDLVVGRAAGAPMLGTDGLLLDGQTLDADPETVPVVVEGVALADGTFEAPFSTTLPVQIFDVSFAFTLQDGRIRGRVAPDGTVTGVFAGGVDVDDLLEVAGSGNIDPALQGILATLLDQWADLAPGPDGTCEQLSIGFTWEAVPVFLYE